eukprot:11185301-Lingulodinium_polyedra.AAC.1
MAFSSFWAALGLDLGGRQRRAPSARSFQPTLLAGSGVGWVGPGQRRAGNFTGRPFSGGCR